MHIEKTGSGPRTGFSRLPLYTLLTSRGPSPDMDDFPPSRLRPSPAEVFSTSTHRASCAAVLLPADDSDLRPGCSPSTLESCPPMLRLVSPHLELCFCRPHPSACLSTFCKHRQGTVAQAEIPTVSAQLRVDWSHASGIRFDFLPALAAEHHSLVLTTCDTQMPGLMWDVALPSSFCEGYPCFWLSVCVTH